MKSRGYHNKTTTNTATNASLKAHIIEISFGGALALFVVVTAFEDCAGVFVAFGVAVTVAAAWVDCA